MSIWMIMQWSYANVSIFLILRSDPNVFLFRKLFFQANVVSLSENFISLRNISGFAFLKDFITNKGTISHVASCHLGFFSWTKSILYFTRMRNLQIYTINKRYVCRGMYIHAYTCTYMHIRACLHTTHTTKLVSYFYRLFALLRRN